MLQHCPQQRPQPLALASSNLDTFDGSPVHSRHVSLAGAGLSSPAGSAASGVMPAAERDGLAAPSVEWQLGALAEEVRNCMETNVFLYPSNANV